MRILVTGHEGYIGSVMTPMLTAAGHAVTGIDSGLFDGCTFGPQPTAVSGLRKDIRDVTPADLEDLDAVVHLAAISNDPIGNLDASATDAINHAATVQVARAAKEAGVKRFLFASSCSLYGAADPEDLLDESADMNPVTAYGVSKIDAEGGLLELCDQDFTCVLLRNATVYGLSPKLRADLVVNNLVGFAYTTGKILMMSDGTPWRPLLHVQDFVRAFIAALEAPADVVNGQAFNVGRQGENYQIRDIAEIVAEVIPGTEISYAEGAGPDARCYRVDFSKFARTFPEAGLHWDVRRGVEELADAYERIGLTHDDFVGERLIRLQRVRRLQEEGKIDASMRWASVDAVGSLSAESDGGR